MYSYTMGTVGIELSGDISYSVQYCAMWTTCKLYREGGCNGPMGTI